MYADQKISVKGVLIREGGTNNYYLTSTDARPTAVKVDFSKSGIKNPEKLTASYSGDAASNTKPGAAAGSFDPIAQGGNHTVTGIVRIEGGKPAYIEVTAVK
jgi:hypothetical protein